MIVCFHEIGYEQHRWAITPEEFVQFLKKNPKAEIHFDDGRLGAYRYGAEILEANNRTATFFIIPLWLTKGPPPFERYSNFMTMEQIKDLVKRGFTIGSHSYNHEDLSRYHPVYVKQDLKMSKQYLENYLGVKIKDFSYPAGRATEAIAAIADKIFKNCYTLDNPLGKQRLLFNRDMLK